MHPPFSKIQTYHIVDLIQFMFHQVWCIKTKGFPHYFSFSSLSSSLIRIQTCDALSEDTDLCLPAWWNAGRAKLGCCSTSERSSRTASVRRGGVTRVKKWMKGRQKRRAKLCHHHPSFSSSQEKKRHGLSSWLHLPPLFLKRTETREQLFTEAHT